MNIALIAQDAKKELMVRLCIAYCGVLSRHKLCATASTGKMVSDATGLRVYNFLSGAQGGYQQIASRISCGELDMLIFFRDYTRVGSLRDSELARSSKKAEEDLLGLCDFHVIPYATNIATAEVLVHGLERGDLDWRNIGNPKI